MHGPASDIDWGPVEGLSRVAKPASVLDLGAVGVGPLRTVVANISERAWDTADAGKPNRFFCFDHTRHMVFRFFGSDPRLIQASPSWTMFRPVLSPLMEGVVASYGLARPAFPKVMLARLAAGESIDRHRDGGVGNYVTHKIHVPVQTNPGALFGTEDDAGRQQLTHLAAGRAYEVNNVGTHWVENRGGDDRIHLIFEVFDAAGHAVREGGVELQVTPRP